MTTEQQDIINGLNGKVQELLLVYERTRAECNSLRAAMEERSASIEGLSRQVSELEEKNKKLQLADAFKASSTDTRDAKLKIGRIVREIDKCVALLNK